MKRVLAPEQRALEHAREQYLLVTGAQLRACGLNRPAIRRRVKSGWLEPLGRDVFCIGAADRSFRQRARAACLAFEDRAALFGPSAGVLYRLAGVRTNDIEVVTTLPVRSEERPFAVHRTNYLPHSDLTVVHGIPATTPPRTLFDICAELGPSAARRAVDDALIRRLITLPRLFEQGDRLCQKGRRGSVVFRELLEKYEPEGPNEESDLERAMISDILRYGFPEPQKQLPVWEDGVFLGRLDAAYPKLRIGLEADGYDFHSAWDDWLRDRRKQNALVSRNWRILRYTSADADRPSAFISDLRRLFAVSTELWAS
jgi:hypothetical protein